MVNNSSSSAVDGDGMPDTVFKCVIQYIHELRYRETLSLVCRRWYEVEGETRHHVTIAFCYSCTPDRLLKRFPFLESLKLKGKPRAAMFNLIPEDWGGYASPWIKEIAESFTCIKSLHFRRMIVTDSDLKLLATTRGNVLKVLKLDKCSGFSTDGLFDICRSCSNLETLFLEESQVDQKDSQWLHELALNNTALETLNFYMTKLDKVDCSDLELLAKRCFLVSVKISDCDLLDLVGFFDAAAALEEFCGGSFTEQPEKYYSIRFPPGLRRLALTYMGKHEMRIVFPFVRLLKKLDLLYALLDTDDIRQLLSYCTNLNILETRDVIGDLGMEVLARFCKKLRRLRIERGADDEGGVVSQRGLTALAQGCPDLEYIAVYVSDINNEALESVGTHLKNLNDFRLVLLDREETITDLPLDNGVRALLRGCSNLTRFALYLRPGGLSDVGLSYVGQYSQNVRWMLLGNVGESDAGLINFSEGCPKLQKLEVRGSCFSEGALAHAVLQLVSLRYLWVQGYSESTTGYDLLAMERPFWNIELYRPRQDDVGEFGAVYHPHILAYYSLAGPRTDFPDTVIHLVSDNGGFPEAEFNRFYIRSFLLGFLFIAVCAIIFPHQKRGGGCS